MFDHFWGLALKGLKGVGIEKKFTKINQHPFPSHFLPTLREKCPCSGFSGSFFPAFGLNTLFLRIQSECGKIRTIKTPNTDTFHAVLRVEEAFGDQEFNHLDHCIKAKFNLDTNDYTIAYKCIIFEKTIKSVVVKRHALKYKKNCFLFLSVFLSLF